MMNQEIQKTGNSESTASANLPKVSSKSEIDKAIADLDAHKQLWADLGIEERIHLFRETLELTRKVSDKWIKLDVKSRLIPETSLNASLSYAQLGALFRLMHLYLTSLEDIKKFERPQYSHAPFVLPNSQVSLQVLPENLKEKILFSGITSEIWFEPGVQLKDLPNLQARPYHTTPKEGKIALVLGSGNYSSLTVGDLLYKLINELRVIIVKVHPVTEFVGEIIEECFAPFIKAGFVRIVYGGVKEGEYIVTHPSVDEIHMTGSDKTFEAIVFGSGPQGKENKRNRKPQFNKKVTGELGNVTPVIVVPGPWNNKDIDQQAENIFAYMVVNNGYTCVANRLLIQSDSWPATQTIYTKIRQFFQDFIPEKAYYPGSERRIREAIKAHPNSEVIGEFVDGKTPWVFASHLNLDEQHLCFQQEIFGSFYGGVNLSANNVPEFIDKAVDFCNKKLWGTLGISLIVHPNSLKDPLIKAAVDRAVANLQYGSIGVNTIAGLNYMVGRNGWGGYPNSSYEDVQSGIGWVNNTLMFDRVQKSISRGPFSFPFKPPNFVTSPGRLRFSKAFFEYERFPSWFNLFKMLLVFINRK
jgi:acyl-CoA reductase-like NAD-dependent aldehyde dehydrogenase